MSLDDAGARSSPAAGPPPADLLIQTAAGYAFVTSDPRGVITGWSAGAEKVLGWRGGEAVGQPTSLFFTPEDRECGRPAEEMEEALVKGSAADERWHLRKDGSRFWASGELFPLHDNGRHMGFLKVLRDRTRGRETEERLEQSEQETKAAHANTRRESERLYDLFESAPGLIAVVSGPDYIFEIANQSYRRMAGERDFVGRPAREVMPELEEQGFFALLDEVYRTGIPYVGENALVEVEREPGKPREQRYINFIYQPIKDADGKVTGIFAEGIDVTGAVLADASLREAERRLDAVLNNASVSIFLMDERQHCAYMNAAAERLTGYSFAETQGRPLHDVIHHTRPDGSPFPLHECAIDRAFPENNNVGGEEVFVHKDGHFYEVAFTASPIRDQESKTVGTIIEVRDISAEKEAARALEAARESAETLAAEQSAVLDQLAEGVVVADAEGRITFINEAAAVLHGTRRVGVLPEAYSETYNLFTEEGEPFRPHDLPMARAVRGETVTEARWRIRRPDGADVLAIGGARPIVGSDGRRMGAVLTLRDDTERREAERALDEERRILDTLNQTGAAVAAELDLQRVVQMVIDAAVDITGAQFGAFFYNTINQQGEAYMLYALSGVAAEAFSGFPMPRATPVFRPTFEGDGVVRSDDITTDPRYGHEEPYRGMPKGHLPVRSYLAVPVISRSGAVLGGLFFGHEKKAVFAERHERLLVGIAGQSATAIDNARLFEAAQRELDERRRAEEALRELNQTLEQRITDAVAERERIEEALRQAQKMEAVGQLTGGIAHDFNNLLTVVSGNIDMARRSLGEDGDPRALRAIGNAMKGADRAAALTQRLLAFSRRQPLQPKPVDSNRLIAGMSELLDRALGETVELEVVEAAGLWRVEVDPNQLENAILNLAVNARDAMPEGGKLTIETSNTRIDESYSSAHAGVAAGQYVLIAVTDTGTGMPPEVLQKAWDPFFSTKEVGKGTGLGLSQVYGYVKQSGGHVKIYSELGEGTTVKIYLPRLMADAHLEDEPQLHQAEPAAGEENILVVEDDDDVRIYTVESLRELGYRVLEAHDGASALRLLERQETPVKLLLTDVVMPGMSGRELADEARARHPELKVLFTTGYARNAIVHGGRLDPGVELLPKPFTFDALAAKVRDVLEKSESERILLIDGDEQSRASTMALAEKLGVAIEEAADRGEGLGKLRALGGGYAAVIVTASGDVDAIVAELRSVREDLPILIVSAPNAAAALGTKYHGERCIGVIAQGFDAETLRAGLRELRVRCEIDD
jgi:PAS domain S-box-containing protein